MYVLLVIAFIATFVSALDKHRLTRYIKKYEIVDCIVSNPRTKRYLFNKNERITKSFDAEVRFKSYEINFYLILNEDNAFKKLKVEAYSHNNSIQSENVTVNMFEGIMKNKSVRSYVVGYLKDDVFTGSVNLNETLYFVEPARNFFSNYTFVNKIIVYREEDVVYESVNGTQSFSFGDYIVVSRNKSIFPNGINKTGNETEDYACVVEFVSDHTLYEYFQRDVNEVTAFLYLHGKYADFIFRRTDFDGDGNRDHIRIIVDKISIYKSANESNYPMNSASDMYTFLKKFSYRTQEYCLAICMTARVFTNTVIGAAFKANDVDTKPPGGICQKPIESPYHDRENRSLNTAVLTIKNVKGNTLPLSVTLLALAHELGHSFGSDHDTMENLVCSPGSEKGFYLMHPVTQTNRTSLNSFFSPCSKTQIAGVIAARGECLKPHPATCGNAIQEGDEECDCGKRAFCQYVDRCCSPSDAASPEKGCTFNKAKKAACSFKENKCCLDNCSISPNTSFQCYNGFSECKTSFCDGKSRTCPEPKEAPDKYPCRGTSQSCSGGVCNSSVCLDNDLLDCVCDDIESECYICCKKKDKCVTASSLGFKTPGGQLHFALEGSDCYFKRYQCDGSGHCVNPRRRDKVGKRKKMSLPVWVYILGCVLALIILVGVLIYFSKFYPT